MNRSALSLLSCLLALAVPAPARATTADDLCVPASVACVIDQSSSIDADSVLDFGARAVTLTRGTALDAGPATMTLRAATLTLEPGAALLARGLRVGPNGGTIMLELTGALRLQATGNTRARLDVSGEEKGGLLDVDAGGDVDIAGVLAAHATAGGTGGRITLTAGGRVTFGDGADTVLLRASGGGHGGGGTVTIMANGSVLLGAPVDVSGGDGGTLEITTLGDLTTAVAADIDASATGTAGEGGEVTFDATGSITSAGPIVAPASGNSLDGGVLGGTVMMTAGGSIALTGAVNAAGAPPDGTGGDVDLLADLDLIQSASVSVRDTAVDGFGGSITLASGRLLVIGPLDLRGGSVGAGTLSAAAGSAATVVGEVDADASGDGGLIAIRAATLTVTGSAHANGTDGSAGGVVDLSGCALTVSDTGRLSATGASLGVTGLRASVRATVAQGASLTAGSANRIEYRDPASPPTIAGTVVPEPQLILNPALPPCSGPAHCGDGQVDADEACDDGNDTPCDGCSPRCEVEACGNHAVDCGEGCDDGNRDSGDGCDADCTRTACGNRIVTAGEECDDGNTVACDGCSPTCVGERCGNGVVECGEECDEGAANGTPASLCDAACRVKAAPSCGDGTLDAKEQCDDHNVVACDGCSATCHQETCGNGTVECAEQCDDFNTDPCDGCSSTCRREQCGNGVTDCHEECDDGNDVDGDGCDRNCTRTRCGNGIVTPPEQCDDGNTDATDACDGSCRRRVVCPAGFCTPCVADTDCDPNGRCAGQQCAAGACTTVTPFSCDDGVIATADRCVLAGGAPQCQHTCLQASACDDGDPCNGPERCDAGTCRAGSAPAGFMGATCSLDAIDRIIAAIPDGTLRPRVRRKLGALAATARSRLTAALAAEARGRTARERRALGQANKALAALLRFIGRGQLHGKVPDTLAETVIPGITSATDAVAGLRDGLVR